MHQYEFKNDAWCRIGSYEHFNRVLYGGHAKDDGPGRYFTFAGDTPIFMGASSDYQKDTWCYQAKNGVLASGLALTPGHVEGNSRDTFSKWFHDVGDTVASWHHGYMDYDMTQFSTYFPDVHAKITVLPLNPDEGFLVQYDITTDQRVIWCAGFGGITPFFGRFEYHHSNNRDFAVKDSEDNKVELHDGYASISGPLDVTMLVGDNFGVTYEADAPEALTERFPSMFLTKHEGDAGIVKMSHVLQQNEHLQGTLVILRNGTPERLKELLQPGVPAQLRNAIRQKYASVSFFSPDKKLDATVTDTLIAEDASFHGNSFYHGAIGYHAPFLGWRGWYAPSLAGWYDRVSSAIKSHFNTILHSDKPEKVWWDGADRPDLDHEGTQYHHLENTSGRMTALLYRDDIYDMQEVAIDMTLHYFDRTRDLETASIIYDRLLEALDWQERILDPDQDGLYQNFLNTWISDGHCYNGAGCAQASCYNLRSNLRTAALGRLLGRDVSKLERRAEKIRNAVQSKLWLNDKGILAESLDTIGNKLLHASPELSTIYLAIECDMLSTEQAARLLLWAKRNLVQVTTKGSRQGKLYYSARWLPKKYSTDGLFPAENAALALVLFKVGFAKEAMSIVNGLADAFELTVNPGSIQHVLSNSGADDAGDIDFTDTSSTYLRMLLEGMWGVRFALLDNSITLAPQVPDEWDCASLTLRDIAMTIRHESLCDILTVNCDADAERTILLPMRYGAIDGVYMNGAPCDYEITQGIERGRITIKTAQKGHLEIKVYYNALPLTALVQASIKLFPESRALVETTGEEITSIVTPAGVSADAPVIKLGANAKGGYDVLVYTPTAILPLEVNTAVLPQAKAAPTRGKLECIDIASQFNSALTEVHNQQFKSPRPAGYSIGVRLNGRYAWEWNHYGHNALHVEDTDLRNANGTFTVPSGIPFLTPASGNNVLAVSIWDNFPTTASLPLSGNGKRLHLFFCGSTNAMQSEVVNARFKAVYKDGTETALDLIQPVNFDDFLISTYQKEAESFYVSTGTHGIHVAMELQPGKELKELKLEAVANEVILMLLGITIER